MVRRGSQFQQHYGPWAVVAGASEGLGAEFVRHIAARGVNVVAIARRAEVLRALAVEISEAHGTLVRDLALDLADASATRTIREATADLEVGLLVYNAAVSVIGPFLERPVERHRQELEVNCVRPLELLHHFGAPLRERGSGGLLLMSSLAGSQGSPSIAHYAASKSWSRVLAEGLWYELADAGVDVLACCAGATRTPRYLADRSEDSHSSFVPEMEPRDVVVEAFAALGRTPSMIPGLANRLASFLLQRLLPRRTAVSLMGRASRSIGVE